MLHQSILAFLSLAATTTNAFTVLVPTARPLSYKVNSSSPSYARGSSSPIPNHLILASASDENNNDSNNERSNEEAEKLRTKAEELREQIRAMEDKLQSSPLRANNNAQYIPKSKLPSEEELEEITGKSLKNKRVLVVGANGRLGSMVTRYILRNHPEVKEVVAAVHYVGQATTRGYGRLSYEVGAEDGVGYIGAAWSPEEERNARFEFSEAMRDYNLQNLVSEQKFSLEL